METRSVWETALAIGRRAGAATAIAVMVGLGCAAAAQERAQARVAHGGDSTAFVRKIQWSSSSPAPGVTLLSGVYSDPSARPFWTVTIQAPVPSPFGGSAEEAEAGTSAWAAQIEASLRDRRVRPDRDRRTVAEVR